MDGRDAQDADLSRRHMLGLFTTASVGAVLGGPTLGGCAQDRPPHGGVTPSDSGLERPDVSQTVTVGPAAPSSTSGTDGVPDSVTISDLLATWPFHVAHRGGSANWPEMTLAAYDNSYRSGIRALEISLHRSADGVFVCSHDDSLARVTTSQLSIAKNAWSALRGFHVRLTEYTSAPSPSKSNQKVTLCRLEDVLDRYADKCVLFVEDKTQQHSAALIRILKRYPGIENRIVWKVHNSVQEGALAIGRDHGLTTWGYFFAKEMDKFEAMAPRFSWLGLDYRCSTQQLQRATSLGKTTVGHIVHTADQYKTLVEAGCNGIMLGNIARMQRRGTL